MFHFPAYTPTQAMNSPAGNTTQLVLGFPIRTSSDQRLVGNSPRHNAASHVLHRLSMPRHPPYALNKKHYKTHTQKIKMLASTIQFSHTTPQPPSPVHTRTQAKDTRITRKQHTCCPRHPTACQQLPTQPHPTTTKNSRVGASRTRFCLLHTVHHISVHTNTWRTHTPPTRITGPPSK